MTHATEKNEPNIIMAPGPGLSPFGLLWRILAHNRRPYSIIVLLTAMTVLATTLQMYAVKLFVDHATAATGRHAGSAWAALGGPAAAMIALGGLVYGGHILLKNIVLSIHPQIRRDLASQGFAYVQRHSAAFFQDHFVGAMVSRVSDLAMSASMMLNIILWSLLPVVLTIVAIVVMLGSAYSWLGLVTLGWALVFIGLAVLLARPLQRRWHDFSAARSTAIGQIADSLSNNASVKSFAREDHEAGSVFGALEQTRIADREAQAFQVRCMIMLATLSLLLLAALTAILVGARQSGAVTAGDFALVFGLVLQMFTVVRGLTEDIAEFAVQYGTCRQALELVRLPHAIVDAPHARPLVVEAGRISFDRIRFSYADHQMLVLNDLTLDIAAGEKVGIVGSSGSGKSTLVALLQRQHLLTRGAIRIDGQSIDDVTLRSLREAIAVVPQDIALFHRSLLENIRYGRPDATDEEVRNAARAALCDDFALALDRGYDTEVGERGARLSGGQRQRIAIARAILKAAPILVLDEATAALDTLVEHIVQQSVARAIEGRTAIVIAHRLSTLNAMDRIVVLEGGRIVEEGAHDVLLRARGAYHRLWQAGQQFHR